uniref:Alpha-2-macroglobulin-like n=1 Tax=Sander lucioperca TaxID=283035 RepID=A0A8C9XLT2_SANLU
MGCPGIQMWTWKLCVFLSWMCVGQVVAGPQYMVAIPAILESGAETKFCASLLQPSETLEMSVTLMSQEKNTTLLTETSSKEFHTCTEFKVSMQDEVVQNFVVEVRGDTFYSKEVRKVQIKVYRPMTFIQTDKPIYLPGQTGNFDFLLSHWLNETSNSKILQLSYALNSEARQGAYQVTVSIGLDQIQHSFKVEKYVLPKFDVKLNAFDEVSINQEEIEAEVCATYTYGQPVPGSVDFKVCRPFHAYIYIRYVYTPGHPEGIPDIQMPCYEETKQTDKRGCATFIFTMSTFTKIDQNVLRDVLQLSANMEEEGTGISRSQEKTTVISYVVGKLSFTDTPKIYNNGSNVEGKVSAFVYYNNTPIPDMPVFLLEGERWSARWLQNLTTDSDGVATFSFSTADFKGDIHLQVSDTPTLGYPPYRTPYYDSKDHTVSLATLSSPDTKTVSFLDVKKKDEPLSCGKEEDISIQYTVVGEAQGFMDVMYLVSGCMANLLIYGVNEGEVSFKLTVSPDMAPDVQVVAYAILPSETVIANSADFSTEQCFSHKVSLEFSPSSAVPGEETIMQVTAQPESLCGVSAVDQSVLIKEPGKTLDADKVTTGINQNYIYRHHSVSPARMSEMGPPVPVGAAGASDRSSPDKSPIETVRTFFPETWIWDLVEVGESGTKDVSLTVPDTITTWETEAFCLSPQGFGLAPRKNITVFQPFFLELSLPYSIIRGEHFELKATTFNYLTIKVGNLKQDDKGRTFLSINQMETLCQYALTEEMNIQLPENMIDGSARASVSVLGDILGRALENLDGLLQMPYGCGEQNMALLAPNIYILEYLRNTQQLTPAIREEATNFLTSGYQRQLNYKHEDGAYSTFGAGPGNTWLTAFVLRSFSKAQSFIYIDPANIEASVTWLKSKQRKNGCFEQSGKLFNNRMKGGVSDEVTLSAYITAAFLEMNTSIDDPADHGPVNASLSCLKESISNLSNTYTTALLAYVFTLAGDMETRDHLLKHLDAVVLQEGGFLHWSQTATETSASLSVEISSYVLLAKLSASPTVEDLSYASRIVRWLTSQQNYYGGFSSTQDTVVALQALALYSTLVFSPEGSSTVTVQSPSGQLMFDVNQNNKLLYQEKQLQDVTGKYSLEVKGTACAAIQISLVYNIPTPADVTTLSVEVKPEADCTSKRPKLSLTLTSLYSGKESSTNMVILDIKMLSGFVPDPESLNMVSALLVDRVEQKEDHVLVYIRELPKNTGINHSLKLIQEHQVENLKPAVVKIYDYYQPSDQSDTEYIHPCVAGNKL